MPFEFVIDGGGAEHIDKYPVFRKVAECPVEEIEIKSEETSYFTIIDEDDEVSWRRAGQIMAWLYENIDPGARRGDNWLTSRIESRRIHLAIRRSHDAVAFKLRWWP